MAGATTLALRQALAARAFARTAAYDAAIATWFADRLGETTPKTRAIVGRLAETLRYGENPHQCGRASTAPASRASASPPRAQVQGKELSYNNLNDTDAAYELVAEFDPKASAAVAIIKHANPCGVAIGGTLAEAYRKALACDPVSAFGGIVALNRPLDADAAREIVKIFTEVIIAPDASDEAKAIIAEKKNLRLLLAGGLPDPTRAGPHLPLARRRLPGAVARQRRGGDGALKVVTKRKPTEQELADLMFAFTVAKHVKSNAIVYAKDGATVGIGAGQMSRVDAARMAAWKAADAARAQGLKQSLTIGSVAASDAFFPFADGLAGDRRGRRHRGDPAGRLGARRRGDRRRRRGRPRHGVHRHAPLPALEHDPGAHSPARCDRRPGRGGSDRTRARQESGTRQEGPVRGIRSSLCMRFEATAVGAAEPDARQARRPIDCSNASSASPT